jgi:Putative DNA-binding domain
MSLNFQRLRGLLDEFNFADLFVEVLGWNSSNQKNILLEIENKKYNCQVIAEMSGIPVYEVIAVDNNIPDSQIRSEINSQIPHHEKLLIFVDEQRTRSLWYWVKNENSKPPYIRDHYYVKGQPGDLFISKLASLLFSIHELENGEPSVVDVIDKLREGLDVETVTKKFYSDFQQLHSQFLTYVEGINNDNDRRWYTSVILNRLMFVYFLQRKGFLDNSDYNYLQNLLKKSKQRGENLFYKEFLEALFFKSFAQPEPHDKKVIELVGQIKYLNGGLFLKHPIEGNKKYKISIADKAFEEVLKLFEDYSWNLNDTPGGNDREINPDVLGHIFEKYINQKGFGAYYTRSEITEYLCHQTIDKLIVDRVNAALSFPPFPTLGGYRAFADIKELIFKLDTNLCRLLVYEILPNLSILDPACGSGAFLLAAMKTLSFIYFAVIGAIERDGHGEVKIWLEKVKSSGDSLAYTIKKLIVTDNLYGVDIMEEATEIAKLRLFLALVSSAKDINELKPLPNIDFNIMAGNSLIGLIKVDETRLDTVGNSLQPNILQKLKADEWKKVLQEKDELIKRYKQIPFLPSTQEKECPLELRQEIEELHQEYEVRLDELLLHEFSEHLKIKYEEVQLTGKAKKRVLNINDIKSLEPFHWGYHFDKVLENGGFDVIITNPPWKELKLQPREFFAQYSKLVTQNMDNEAFEQEKQRLLQKNYIAKAWLNYQSQYPHSKAYYRLSKQYKNQISIVNDQKVGTNINLYKLFLEQCFNLLRLGAECGIVIPSGIYTDLGTKQLREMLFNQTKITGLFCFENGTKSTEYTKATQVFEEVHRSFKFVVLTFIKGGKTTEFPSAFMRHDVEELEKFPNANSLPITIDIVRNLSPDSLNIMELKNELDFHITKKMLKFPFLRDKINGKWNLHLTNGLNIKNKKGNQETCERRLPLYEGKMIHQFTHKFAEPKYWVDEKEVRKAVLGKKGKDEGQNLDYQRYRLAFRDVARNTDSRTMISSIIPSQVFAGNTLILSEAFDNQEELLFACAVLNSFTCDFIIRLKVTTHCNMFHVYQLPIPRLTKGDKYFSEIVQRAAKLICTTPEYDDLAQEVGLGSHKNGAIDETERAKLRAELDGIIAHLYGLTEEEFKYILTTFPIVCEQVKQDALEAYRDFTPLTGDAEIIELITIQDESSTLEFKSTARWDVDNDKKNPVMEEVILKTVASFLNTKGGTLLIGVTDEKEIIGLDLDYQTFRKPNKRDAYQLFLMNDLLLRGLGRDLATLIDVTFHEVEQKDVCRIIVKPSPRPVFMDIKQKRCLFVRGGNLSTKLATDEEIKDYCKSRWGSL